MKKVLLVTILFFGSLLNVKANELYQEEWTTDLEISDINSFEWPDSYSTIVEVEDGYVAESRYYVNGSGTYHVIIKVDNEGNLIGKVISPSSRGGYYDISYYYDKYIFVFDGTYNNSNVEVRKYDIDLNLLGTYKLSGFNYNYVSFVNDHIYLFKIASSSDSNMYVRKYNLNMELLNEYSYNFNKRESFYAESVRIDDYNDSYKYYFYDKYNDISVTFNYDTDTFETIKSKIEKDEENYGNILSVFCVSNYYCDYGKIGNYYYVDNYDEVDGSYDYGIVDIFDSNLEKLVTFKNYTWYLDNLIATSDNFVVFVEGYSRDDSVGLVYDVKNKEEALFTLTGAVATKIVNDELLVLYKNSGNLLFAKYHLGKIEEIVEDDTTKDDVIEEEENVTEDKEEVVEENPNTADGRIIGIVGILVSVILMLRTLRKLKIREI